MNSKSDFPLLTIAILSYNRYKELEYTLDVILNELDYPKDSYEVIVVDNASTDGTVEMIRKKYPDICLIVNEENVGMSAINKAFRRARGDYIVVLDDDSHIVEGIKEALSFMKKNSQVGILACKIEGGMFTLDGLNHLEKYIGFIGCGAIISKKVLEVCGGYAEWLFLYAHEWEYSLRVLNEGFEIIYFEKCRIKHRASPIMRSTKRLRTLTVKNELSIVYLYFRGIRMLINLFRILFWNLMCFRYEGLKSIAYVFSGTISFLNQISKIRVYRVKIKENVLIFFQSRFWSLQPILKTLIALSARRIRKMLKRVDEL